MKQCLIVEDHAETRAWWLSALPRIFGGVTARAARSVGEARLLLRQDRFWLAIVDLKLPDGLGVDLIREISDHSPETMCVVSSIFDDDQHVFAALRAGAQGYLAKDEPRDLQMEQLRQIVHGQPPLSPGIARRILGHFSGRDPMPDRGQELRKAEHDLTEREVEVLRLIAKGYSRPEVAEILGLSLNTVSTHTKAIYQKLEISRRAEAVVEAVRLGLIRSE